MQNLKSNYLKCIPSDCLSPLCVLFLSRNFDDRGRVSIVKSTLVSSGTTHIHPSMFSSVGLKIIHTKANDLIYQDVQVAINKKMMVVTLRWKFMQS